jgi:histidinol-phosphatase (PHP family)
MAVLIYRHDYHTHTTASFDGTADLRAMAQAAERMGLTELAITDHCDFGGGQPFVPGLLPLSEFEAVDIPVKLIRGIEIGQPHHEPDAANALLDSYKPKFILASLHNLRGKEDFYHMTYDNAEASRKLLAEYVRELFELVAWGRFSVMGHITYPLRYMDKLGVDAAAHFCEYEDLFRLIIKNGQGIELNVSGLIRGFGTTQPDLPLLKLYRRCGGEIITIGTDSHKPEDVGQCFDDGLSLLRAAGFTAVTSFAGGTIRFEAI